MTTRTKKLDRRSATLNLPWNTTAVLFVVVATTLAISSIIRSLSLQNGIIFNLSYGMPVKQGFSKDEQHTLQIYMHNQRKLLLNESSMINMGLRSAQYDKVSSRFIQDSFPDIEVVESLKSKNISERDKYLNDFASADASRDLLYGGVCDTLSIFRETKGMRRHVLISHLNENWGAFSTHVENRTINRYVESFSLLFLCSSHDTFDNLHLFIATLLKGVIGKHILKVQVAPKMIFGGI